MPHGRGRKSKLPPRVRGTRRLPKLASPRSKRGFRGYIDFADALASLRQAGWKPVTLKKGHRARRVRDSKNSELAGVDEIFAEIVSEHSVSTSVAWSVSEYLSACAYAESPTKFRRQLSVFESALSRLVGKIPAADSAVSVAVDQAVGARAPAISSACRSSFRTYSGDCGVDPEKARPAS
jgi:hypothetical protein